MKPHVAATAALSLVLLLAFAGGATAPEGPPRFELGYWYWRQAPDAPAEPSAVVPDVLYVHVGGLSRRELASARWPGSVPAARSYLATWRSDRAGPPERERVEDLAGAFEAVSAEAVRNGQPIAGLQLDVDCPTRGLREYAAFLRALKTRVGPQARLSITALLDWFSDREAVSVLLASVDEHVPQFYDTQPAGAAPAVAEPIDVESWRPLFEAAGARYRIGVATFGRVRRVRSLATGGQRREAFRDVGLMDLWGARLGPFHVGASPAGETVLRWTEVRRELPGLEPGDSVEAVVPTAASVLAAHAAARRFGPLCDGVVFFRWPAPGESLALTPDEVAEALRGDTAAGTPRLEVTDGACAGLACSDLVLDLPDRLAPREIEVRLVAAADVAYVLQAQPGVRLRQTGPRRIVVRIPGFPGLKRVRLGRAFSQGANHYEIEGAKS